jgi:hypothetical protein
MTMLDDEDGVVCLSVCAAIIRSQPASFKLCWWGKGLGCFRKDVDHSFAVLYW